MRILNNASSPVSEVSACDTSSRLGPCVTSYQLNVRLISIKAKRLNGKEMSSPGDILVEFIPERPSCCSSGEGLLAVQLTDTCCHYVNQNMNPETVAMIM